MRACRASPSARSRRSTGSTGLVMPVGRRASRERVGGGGLGGVFPAGVWCVCSLPCYLSFAARSAISHRNAMLLISVSITPPSGSSMDCRVVNRTGMDRWSPLAQTRALGGKPCPRQSMKHTNHRQQHPATTRRARMSCQRHRVRQQASAREDASADQLRRRREGQLPTPTPTPAMSYAPGNARPRLGEIRASRRARRARSSVVLPV
ncbi:hypothetical protein BC628DRAFT_575740 [Trametes gibbosa]|nr:hypothetical protein BC628DRAFT_575740 [Trametes gibbosa]